MVRKDMLDIYHQKIAPGLRCFNPWTLIKKKSVLIIETVEDKLLKAAYLEIAFGH